LLVQVKIKVKKISASGRLISKMLINSLVFTGFLDGKFFLLISISAGPKGSEKL